MKKLKRAFTILLTAASVVAGICFGGLDAISAYAADDFDIPVVTSITLDTKTAAAGKANDHCMSFELKAYDFSGIAEVYVHYTYADVNGNLDDSGYVLYYGNNNSYIGAPYLLTGTTSNNKEYVFTGTIELNDFKAAGTIAITDIQITDTKGNFYSSYKGDEVWFDKNIGNKTLSNIKVQKKFSYTSYPNSIGVNYVNLYSVSLIPHVDRKGNGVSFGTNLTGPLSNKTIPANKGIIIEPEFDFTTAVKAGFDPSTVKKVSVVTDEKGNYELSDKHFGYAGWPSTATSGSTRINDLVNLDNVGANATTSTVEIVKFRLETADGSFYEVACPSSMNEFYLSNWHYGHDLSSLTFDNVKYYINGSSVPYDRLSSPRTFVRFGNTVKVEFEINDYIPTTELFIQMGGFSGEWFNVEAKQDSSNPYLFTAEFTVNKGEMNASMYYLQNVVYKAYLRANYNFADTSNMNWQFYNSFILANNDNSATYPNWMNNCNYNYFGLMFDDPSQFHGPANQNVQQMHSYFNINYVPGYDTVDKIFDELDKVDTSKYCTAMNVTGNGWRLFELVFDQKTNTVISRKEVFRNSRTLVNSDCNYEAVYDYDKYPVSVCVRGIDGNVIDVIYVYLADGESVTPADLSSVTFFNSGNIKWKALESYSWQNGSKQINDDLSKYVYKKEPLKLYEELHVEPVCDKPLVYASGYYVDDEGGYWGFDELVGYAAGDETTIANYFAQKYGSSFSSKAGFTGYTAKYDSTSNSINLIPKTTNIYVKIYTNEYNSGSATRNWINYGSWMDPSTISGICSSYETSLVPLASDLTFEGWNPVIENNGVFADVVLNAQYDKNIIRYSFSVNGNWFYENEKYAIAVDKNDTDADVTDKVIAALNQTGKAKEFGVTSWLDSNGNSLSVKNENWGKNPATMDYNGLYIEYLVFDQDGAHDVSFDYIKVSNGETVTFPSALDDYKNLDWRMVCYFDQNNLLWDYYNGSQTGDPLGDGKLTIDGRSYRVEGCGQYNGSGTTNPPSTYKIRTASGTIIEVSSASSQTAQNLIKQIASLSKTLTQKEADKIISDVDTMPSSTSSSSNNGTETITVGKDDVKVNSDGEIEIGDNVANSIISSSENIVEIEMGAANVIPASVFDNARNSGKTIVVKKNGYYWTIDPKDITQTPVSINFEVEIDANVIPTGVVDDLAAGRDTSQLSLTHNGTFGLKAKLTVLFGDFGKNNSGKFGNMYYYDSSKRLVFQNCGQFTTDGTLSLDFSHASDYLIVVDDDNQEKVEYNNYKEGVKESLNDYSQDGDNDASKALIADTEKAIAEYQYDENLSYDENQAKIDEMLANLEKQLEEQRKAEKEAAEKETADTVAANAALDAINAIGSVSYSDESKEKIEEARKAYDSLTEDQKAKISAEDYKKLTDAEEAYAKLEASHNQPQSFAQKVQAVVKKVIKAIKGIFSKK